MRAIFNLHIDRRVCSARTTAMPSLHELTTLFDILPEMPLPPPRKRNVPNSTIQQGKLQSREGSSTNASPSQPGRSWSSALWAFFQYLLSFLPSVRAPPLPQRARPTSTSPKPNPFPALKTGKKTIVIAAVDAGNISFFRFGQGVFEEWPMI